MPPIATYACLCLWNWKLKCPEGPLELDNLATISTITGRWDESWFYLVSVAIEAKGGQAVLDIYAANSHLSDGEEIKAAARLTSLRDGLVEIKRILIRMYENCRADVFYHEIRPKLQGMSNMTTLSGARGIECDTGSGHFHMIGLGGPSNGQSSLLQALDLLLGVEHGSDQLKNLEEQKRASWLEVS
jgi:indoleamine 2,3-dioxygenase